MEAVGLYKIYKLFFPMCLYRLSLSYNRKMHSKKKELFRGLQDFRRPGGQLTLLEIGCGSGTNFEFYPAGSKVICTDPNPQFQRYLKASMAENQHLAFDKFAVASGEDLGSVEDESVDVVVCTLVLCSVTDVAQTLREALRILRPVSLLQAAAGSSVQLGCEQPNSLNKHCASALPSKGLSRCMCQ